MAEGNSPIRGRPSEPGTWQGKWGNDDEEDFTNDDPRLSLNHSIPSYEFGRQPGWPKRNQWGTKGFRTYPQNNSPSYEDTDELPQSSPLSHDLAADGIDDIPQPIEPEDMGRYDDLLCSDDGDEDIQYGSANNELAHPFPVHSSHMQAAVNTEPEWCSIRNHHMQVQAVNPKPERSPVRHPITKTPLHTAEINAEKQKQKPTGSGCGFGPRVERTIWGIWVPSRDPNFRTAIMDIVISERLDMDPGQPSSQDANGRLKPTSKVRFNTRSLTCPDPGPGDVILRLGRLIPDTTPGRLRFRWSSKISLYELVWQETSSGDFVQEGDSQGLFMWESTSHIMNTFNKKQPRPWPWRFIDAEKPLRSGDMPNSKYCPRKLYILDDLAKCLVLRRKTDGKHDHDCQKLEWYPCPIPERQVLLDGDFIVRFGVVDLKEDPDNPNSPDILACVEAWRFCRQYFEPTEEDRMHAGTSAAAPGESAEFTFWVFLGRDECWMKGEYDIGFKGKTLQHTSTELSEFVPRHEWPKLR